MTSSLTPKEIAYINKKLERSNRKKQESKRND
jgi:hypothetical protein